MIRVAVHFPESDWAAVPRIRSAARALAGVPGLVEVRLSKHEESGPGIAPTGPVAEIAFESADEMREALRSPAWERLVGAGGGEAPALHAYAVAYEALTERVGAGGGTTDVDVAAEEATPPWGEAEPLSTTMQLPLPQAGPRDEDAEQGPGGS